MCTSGLNVSRFLSSCISPSLARPLATYSCFPPFSWKNQCVAREVSCVNARGKMESDSPLIGSPSPCRVRDKKNCQLLLLIIAPHHPSVDLAHRKFSMSHRSSRGYRIPLHSWCSRQCRRSLRTNIRSRTVEPNHEKQRWRVRRLLLYHN